VLEALVVVAAAASVAAVVLIAVNQLRAQQREFLAAVTASLKNLGESSDKKLELMRTSIDGRLDQVHKTMGEMQSVAAGVSDLKKIFSNVRTRGLVGEVLLKALVKEVLRPGQYAENVAVTGTAERVEVAIKLPGNNGGVSAVWLPVDSKFPLDVYQRLVDADVRGDLAAVEAARKELVARLKLCARDIRDKYVQPPATTDFGILFVPTEALYAEILRNAGLVETLQRDYKVTVAGPTTLGALLTSLQMGFQTLAVQHHSSEVWELLGAVKADFARYADSLARVQRKLQEAGNALDDAAAGTRRIERRLRSVEAAPDPAEVLNGENALPR
jgi:DNA recombination protein RmuC